jgi:hypothetical protein
MIDNTTGPVRSDREDAARYPDVANQLRRAADHYGALAVCAAEPHPELFDTFAASVRNLLARHYEEMQTALSAMADTAQDFADQARERLGVSA